VVHMRGARLRRLGFCSLAWAGPLDEGKDATFHSPRSPPMHPLHMLHVVRGVDVRTCIQNTRTKPCQNEGCCGAPGGPYRIPRFSDLPSPSLMERAPSSPGTLHISDLGWSVSAYSCACVRPTHRESCLLTLQLGLFWPGSLGICVYNTIQPNFEIRSEREGEGEREKDRAHVFACNISFQLDVGGRR